MGTSHIAGASEEMRPFDDLSRERLPEGFDELKFVETSNDARLLKLFAACNNLVTFQSFIAPSSNNWYSYRHK